MSATLTSVQISSRLSATVWYRSEFGGSHSVDFWIFADDGMTRIEVDPAIDHIQDLRDFMQDIPPAIHDPEALCDAVQDRLISEHG